jgi:pectin lyase
MEKRRKLSLQMIGFITALMMILSVLLVLPSGTSVTARAISSDYPVQLMNLASKNNSTVLTESGTADNSAVVMKALGNDLSPSWRFDRVGSDSKGTYFKLCNAQSG